MRVLIGLCCFALAGCGSGGLSPYEDVQDTDPVVETPRDDTGSGADPVDTGSETQDETACPEGEVEDCSGGCLPERWIGDGLCQERFDCATLNYDDGDCGDCPSGEILDCSGGCVPERWLGDGTCQVRLDCAATSNDDGDCAVSSGCASNEIEGCTGACVLATKLGDGRCVATRRNIGRSINSRKS